MMSVLLDQLIDMSRALSEPSLDYVILGEGNTSVIADEDTFWVKASGTQLAQADRESFVRVKFEPVLNALDGEALTDAAVKEILAAATVEGNGAPSIETFLHALCLRLDGVLFVGHTHPTAALSLLCSQQSRKLFAGSMFPDQIVLLGPSYVYIPYTDPGLPLALAVRKGIEEFVEIEGRVPKVILMENHGVIALGGTVQDVLNVTQMLVKTCRIAAGTAAGGGPRFLSDQNVQRIDQRPDELARRQRLR
jgi:rhamnose utilization protein RhaD (predicted bifunctional aldolase and dehydrogenase)